MVRPRGQINLDLSPSRLAYFLAIFDAGTLNAAAHTTGITQQALSKSLAKLEQSLGVTLFERTPLGLQPTLYAERLAERARTILAESEMAASEMEALRGFRSGLVRLGAGPSLAALRVPRVIAELRRRLPDVGVSVIVGNTDQLFPKLMQGTLDLIVSAPVPSFQSDESLVCENFGTEFDEVVGRAEHPLRNKQDISLADFSKFPWIGEAESSHVIRRASNVFVKAGLPPFVDVIMSNSMDFMTSVILETDTLSLLHPELYLRLYESGQIAPFHVPEFRMERQVRMYQRAGAKPMPAVRLTIEILRSHLSVSSTGYTAK